MPYRRQACAAYRRREAAIKGKIRVRLPEGGRGRRGLFPCRLSRGACRPGRRWISTGWRRRAGAFRRRADDDPGTREAPFWLEGDDRFTVDGKLAIHGTGSEDFFNCGWYALEGRLNGPAAYPTHGFPIYRSPEKEVWQAAAYRWNVADPVPYSSSISAGIEHGGENQFEADYRAGVFWYAQEPTRALVKARYLFATDLRGEPVHVRTPIRVRAGPADLRRREGEGVLRRFPGFRRRLGASVRADDAGLHASLAGRHALHLSEHHGDCCPGSTVYVRAKGLDAYHAEIMSKGYPNMRPGVEETAVEHA